MILRNLTLLFAIPCLFGFGGNEASRKANEQLFKVMEKKLELNQEQMNAIKKVFARQGAISQGNPEVSKYAMTKQQCLDKKIEYSDPSFRKICKSPYMAPLYDPTKEKAQDAKVCIDQFEFPNIPCEYPPDKHHTF